MPLALSVPGSAAPGRLSFSRRQDMSINDCKSRALQVLMLSDNVRAQAHQSGVTVIGEWDHVMRAARAANQALLDLGVAETHLSLQASSSK